MATEDSFLYFICIGLKNSIIGDTVQRMETVMKKYIFTSIKNSDKQRWCYNYNVADNYVSVEK